MDSSFVAPGHGPLTADGEVIAHDADVAFCRAAVTDQHGRLVAQALGSFRYLARPGDGPSHR
jgi:acyl-coenzyme A thioesterase PaaI-like protein